MGSPPPDSPHCPTYVHFDLIVTRLELETPTLLLQGEDLGLGVVEEVEEPAASGTIQQHAQVPRCHLHLALKTECRAAAQHLRR